MLMLAARAAPASLYRYEVKAVVRNTVTKDVRWEGGYNKMLEVGGSACFCATSACLHAHVVGGAAAAASSLLSEAGQH